MTWLDLGLQRLWTFRVVSGPDFRPRADAPQLLEDTLYQHHYALRDQDLVDTSRQLHDPQGVGPPVALVDVEELFEPAILDWVIGLRESVRMSIFQHAPRAGTRAGDPSLRAR